MVNKTKRTVGDIFLQLEEIFDELIDQHDFQFGDILYWVFGHLTIHRPDAREQYVKGGHPIIYGPRLKKKRYKLSGVKMKTELIFKLEKEPAGFGQVFDSNCSVKIKKTEGNLYLNYEKRAERIVGSYKNLRQEGENILADVEIFDKLKVLESRLEYSIEGAILEKNENGEVKSIEVNSVAALMDSKF